jgi:pilus assembly protein CpaC
MPVLGPLFRSVRYERKETELLVLVTPRLVEAMDPDQSPPAPGEYWRHPKESDLFWNRDLGGPATDQGGARPITEASAVAPRFRGQYGFQPVQQQSAPQ